MVFRLHSWRSRRQTRVSACNGSRYVSEDPNLISPKVTSPSTLRSGKADGIPSAALSIRKTRFDDRSNQMRPLYSGDDELIVGENLPIRLCPADVKAVLRGSHAANLIVLDELEIRVWIPKQASEQTPKLSRGNVAAQLRPRLLGGLAVQPDFPIIFTRFAAI